MLETQRTHYKMRMKVFNSDQQRVMYLLLIRIPEMTCEKKLDSHYRGSHYSLYIFLSHTLNYFSRFFAFFRFRILSLIARTSPTRHASLVARTKEQLICEL